MANRLLIVACSGRKNTSPGLMPAFERYNGVNYNVIRSYIKAGGECPRIWILSAKYGLIRTDTRIPDYNQKMTRERALELRPDVFPTIGRFRALDSVQLDSVFICMGATYLLAMPSHEYMNKYYFPDASITYAKGGIGVMLGQLKSWLYGIPPTPDPALNHKKLIRARAER